MTEEALEFIQVETGKAPELSVVWLHGLGADGHDFEPIVPELRLPFAARFVFPHAPVRPITINGGMPMRAWFDILTLERGRRRGRHRDYEASAAAVAALLDAEREREALRLIESCLAGFSQGGALALHLGLRYPQRLAGIAALSAFRAARDSSSPLKRTRAYSDLPIFMAHGTQDGIIELPYAELGRDQLTAAGFAPSWHSYTMAHAVCAEEIRGRL